MEKVSHDALVAYREGNQHLRNKDYEAAIEAYRRALSIYRENEMHYEELVTLDQLSHILGYLERYEEAVRYQDEALKLTIKTDEAFRDIDALLRTAGLYARLEKYKEAIDFATLALQIDPNDPEAYSARAMAYWYSGQLSDAVADYTREIQLLPENEARWALNDRGQAYAEMGEYQRAINDLLLSIRLVEDNGERPAYPYNGLGLAYAGIGDYEKSFAAFEKSIELSPENAWVYFNRAQVYISMEQTDKAILDLRTALLKKNPPLTQLKVEKARAFLESHTGPSFDTIT